MAEEAEDLAEKAMNLIVSREDQSSIMRKTMNQQVFETLSTLRTIIAKLIDSGNKK